MGRQSEPELHVVDDGPASSLADLNDEELVDWVRSADLQVRDRALALLRQRSHD